MLFSGTVGRRQPASGLMWLMIARDSAGADEAWIREAYETAFNEATETERAAAIELLKRHIQDRPY